MIFAPLVTTPLASGHDRRQSCIYVELVVSFKEILPAY